MAEKLILVLCLSLVTIAVASLNVEANSETDFLQLFVAYMKEYNKTYTSIEKMAIAFSNYRNNILDIREWNKNANGSTLYAQNEWTDMHPNVFLAQRGGWQEPQDFRESLLNTYNEPNLEAQRVGIPASFDWRQKNAVTPVKDQGNCGSCWAFSTVAALETVYATKNGKLTTFSEQQLVDCDRKDHGCGGGWPGTAMQYMKDNGGLNTAAYYPYRGVQMLCIRSKPRADAARITGQTTLPPGNEEAMAQHVATKSPLTHAINAKLLQHYKSGIISATKSQCDNSRNSMNHATTIVGYDNNGAWIIKNSWGTNWGEKGYYRVKRGANVCGIANYAAAPTM